MNTPMIILAIVVVLAFAFIAYQFIKHAKVDEPVKYTDKISTPEWTTRRRPDTSSLEHGSRRSETSTAHGPDTALFSDTGGQSSSLD